MKVLRHHLEAANHSLAYFEQFYCQFGVSIGSALRQCKRMSVKDFQHPRNSVRQPNRSTVSNPLQLHTLKRSFLTVVKWATQGAIGGASFSAAC